ncbi:efflux RND transporter permease subunit [Parasphingopyxis algicola]|uniref:efflux RND transporter permease subunit n=1 Tax=Parasphingopyxis algicola TaxID=2026624 RepID=UPI0015A0CA54|nr:efflux RND transporter permease subunit [Parasphingopyxis algicola]QLC26439.1 efflux RND transporter permease subunit [Parasphingopyxis algicola]
MGPAEFSIKNRLISFIVIIGVLVGGWIAYGNMPRFEDPEFTIREAVVITQYPGATPEEVANEVTEPLESAIQQMAEVEEVRSVSSDGLSRITVEVKYGDSTTRDALQLVWTKLRNRVRDAQGSLPPGAQESIVNDDFGDVYGIYYLITGDGYTPRELYEYARDLRTDLLAVDGVAKVAIQGQQQEAIYVEISRERASALGVSVDQVYNDLAQQNSVISAGDVRIGDRRVLIQPTGEVGSVAAIENIVVSTPEADTVIFLRDVATVRRDYVDPPTFLNRYNGEPAIGIGISNVSGANVVAMGEAIDAALAEAESRRPLGIEVHEYYHQGKVTDAAVQAFAINVVMALAIVLITLYFFMGLRSALIIGGVLVLTISATLATMYLSGIPMHRISLGALIIALGMLVDNAIVVTEGILVAIQQGRKKLDIAKEVVARSKWPLLGGTLVGIIAFGPIGFAPGSTAEFTGHLFWVVLISLLFSWVFAITAVPLLADMLFKEVDADAIEEQTEHRFMTRYKDFLRDVLGRPWLAVGAAVGLFLLSVAGFGFVKSGFFPASTTPQLVVDVWLPQGTDFERTFEDVTQLEEEVSAMEGVEGVNTLIGQGALRYMLVYPPESTNSSYGQLLLQVDYDRIGELVPAIQNHINDNYPDAQAKVWQFQLGPGGGSKIEAEFSGPDPAVLRQLSSEAEEIFATDGGLTAIKNDWRQRISVIEPIYSEARSRRLGISREDLANALRTNFSGRNVGVYREGDTLIPIVARAPIGERRDVQSIASVQIPSQVTGGTVPLIETVSGFETVWRDAILRRIDRVWTIRAQADPLPGELASVALERVRPAVENITLPPGYTLTWQGEYGSSTEANENLASTLPIGFLAMVLVVVLLFNALRQPLIIWLVVPLAIIGVVIGLLLTNSAMEFMAILGVLSLSGLLIKNAIVLVDQMDLEIGEGKPRFDAVIDSAASRVRPVAMGAITTVLGVMPLFGDAFFRSMAVVLVFGLSFATILTLVIVPVLYLLFFRIGTDETAAGDAT